MFRKIVQSMLKKPESNFNSLMAEHSLFSSYMNHLVDLVTPKMAIAQLKDVHRIIGRHVLAEFDAKNLTLTADSLQSMMARAAEHAGATILGQHFFATDEGGVSGAIVIAESHLIAHLSKDGYLAIDIYTCGQRVAPMTALAFVEKELGIKPYDVTELNRGVMLKDSASSTSGFRLAPGIAQASESGLAFYQPNYQSRSSCKRHAEHAIVEMYATDRTKLVNADRLADAFSRPFGKSFKVQKTHAFEPIGQCGVSAVFISDGIHITTHPWDENLGYAPIDIYIREGSGITAEEAIRHIAQGLGTSHAPARYSVIYQQRGVVEEGELVPALDKNPTQIRR